MNETAASAPSAPSVLTGKLVPYTEALLAQLTVGVIMPTVLLMLLLAFAFFVVMLAQRRDDFDIADLLREHQPDNTWRTSTFRFAALMAFAVHSAYFYATLWQGTPNPDFFLYYGVIWGGSPAAFELAQAAKQWNGQLPFARQQGPTQ